MRIALGILAVACVVAVVTAAQQPSFKVSEGALVMQSKIWLSWPCDDLKHCSDRMPSRVVFEPAYPSTSLICVRVHNRDIETCTSMAEFKAWASGNSKR